MTYAIGTPGQPVRIYVECEYAIDAESQRGEGEVCISVEQRAMGAWIAADGISLIPGGDA